MRTEIFVSTDVESDGPIPGPNSMLSFASVAYDVNGKEIDSFSRNLELLAGAEPDPRTIEWWQRNPKAYLATREDMKPPEEAMRHYKGWLLALPGPPVCVAYPAGYDFMFVYWYLVRFTGESPFSHSAWDIKTAAAIAMRGPYRQATKRNMPKAWFGPKKHTHVALDDAREQGDLHFAILSQLGLSPSVVYGAPPSGS